ncbi:hypothetical protein [Pseudoxanthomonas wuyuanensis]|uniref:Uncharacterized protein n=1 Tax=Pseudoxanthomonas wuyuanensis TaxID=1073196 RepID=A0A286D818_9GAMM|nr:hypothetical protein [Pseudoxanthomonas wuyuanensis]SOD54773.1 hypothetical protein SAMN06296416_10533 [Pseudoxanthomonas wuyuanensis]
MNGAFDLVSASPHGVVPFQVHALRNPSISWLNYRWWMRNGVDLASTDEMSRLKDRLVAEYAYAVIEHRQIEQFNSSASKVFLADRYGSNSGYFAHGGSGRAAVVGGMSVKGVGATPLVGEGVNREHSHGCASMNVAIREAIYAEVFDLEFRFGAVPVVAIIDTGLTFESSSRPGTYLKRALIVRPSVLRPAHFQRAPGFVRPLDGHHNCQMDDVERTKELIAHFEKDAAYEGNSTKDRLTIMLEKFAQQAAFGQVHRLYGGGFFSSNLSVSGELMDYGNAHAFPDWANAKVLDNDLGFGRELETIVSTAKSLGFYFQKYASCPPALENETEIMERVSQAYRLAFREEILRLWGVPTRLEDCHADAVFNRTSDYYFAQQSKAVNYSRNQESDLKWLSSSLQDGCNDSSHELALQQQVVSDVLSHIEASDRIGSNRRTRRKFSLACARRLLAPRRAIYRSELQKRVNQFLEASEGTLNSLPAFIAEVVNESRRHWPELPGNFAVDMHAHHMGSSILVGWRNEDEEPAVWVEGLIFEGRLELFGQVLPEDAALAADPMARVESTWNCVLPRRCLNDRLSGIQLGEREIEIPCAWFTYGYTE